MVQKSKIPVCPNGIRPLLISSQSLGVGSVAQLVRVHPSAVERRVRSSRPMAQDLGGIQRDLGL